MLDRIKAAFLAFFRSLFPRISYLAYYPGTVEKQSSDLAFVDVTPDDRVNLPGCPNVPLRLGVPGATAQLQQGTRVLLGFDAGDPQRPFAFLFDPSSVTIKLTIQANAIEINPDSSPKESARKGDAVDGGKLAFLFSPGGGGASLDIQHVAPGGIPPVGYTLVSWPGKINAGSGTVKVGD